MFQYFFNAGCFYFIVKIFCNVPVIVYSYISYISTFVLLCDLMTTFCGHFCT